MNIDLDVSTGGDGASVSSFDKDPTPEIGGHWWTRVTV